MKRTLVTCFKVVMVLTYFWHFYGVNLPLALYRHVANENRNNWKSFVVGTHEGTNPCSYPMKNFHEGTCRMDLSNSSH